MIFLVELNNLNTIDGKPISIKVPYLVDKPQYADGFNVWIVLVGTLTTGVLVGFFMAFFQIIAQKSEVISTNSKLRRLQVELDSLRNQGINDDIILSDDTSIEIIDEFNIFGSSTLLFRYSALTFNGHKIHYDIDYTKTEEGHSGLLVHAPLQATYLLNIAKKNNIKFDSFEYRATFPLISNKKFKVQLGKNNKDEIVGLVLNDENILTMKAIFK